MLVAAILAVAVFFGLRRVPEEVGPADDRISGERVPPDSDGDRISDRAETSGLRMQSGSSYITDPGNPDTDGDGLTDGEEAGLLSANPTWGVAPTSTAIHANRRDCLCHIRESQELPPLAENAAAADPPLAWQSRKRRTRCGRLVRVPAGCGKDGAPEPGRGA